MENFDVIYELRLLAKKLQQDDRIVYLEQVKKKMFTFEIHLSRMKGGSSLGDKNYETIVTKLEAKIQVLENKVYDQDKVIASQSRELESLRPQVEGKEELARILADAQNLLDQAI